MKKIIKAIFVNAVIIVLLLGINYFTTSSNPYALFGRFAFAGSFILLTGFINFLIGGEKLLRKEEGYELFFLMGGIIFLIGFSVCTRLA